MWQIGRVVGSLERAVEQGAHLFPKRHDNIYIYIWRDRNHSKTRTNEKRDVHAEGLKLGLGVEV